MANGQPDSDASSPDAYAAPGPVPEAPPELYERRDIYDAAATTDLAAHVESMLGTLGEDPQREGLLKTPERVAKAYQFLTHGYAMDPKSILEQALFAEEYDQMILVKDIEVYSLCEHHMLPFFGKAHVAYIPNGHIVGLSKIPRTVDVFARRLQVQERLTIQIRDAIDEVLKPLGTAVVIEARHMCMMMRGAEKQNSMTTTSAMSGEFRDHHRTRAEFMRLIA
jgi:GTP cyclohydrolase I